MGTDTEIADDDDREFPGLSATYCPEDNKLRLTIGRRLSREDYQALRDRLAPHGFKWAGKQEIFVAPRWTPAAEDLLYELCGDIADEDYSPEERSADRAERFSGYLDKRRDEAGAHADTFDSGPSVFGCQNRQRAERQAARHDRHRGRALSQWSKAEYWHSRTAGVIGHALHKSSPEVRRSRILRLEAEQRKQQASLDEHRRKFDLWSRVFDMEGADIPLGDQDVTQASPPAIKAAYVLSNDCYFGLKYEHPRTGESKDLYDLLRKGDDPLTPREAATLWLSRAVDPDDSDSSWNRWAAHYVLRLSYENAMLANEGGKAADVEIEAGGFIGSTQIQAVNRSSVTGRVVSVKVWSVKYGYTKESNYTKQDGRRVLVTRNIERLGADAYRVPTDEERAAFLSEQKARKATAKASKPADPPLVNPTDEDAERLQALWNAQHRAKYEAKYPPGKYSTLVYKPSEVLHMTQATYSANSNGEYARLETHTIDGYAKASRRSSNMWTKEGQDYDNALAAPVCKLRLGQSGNGWESPPQVIILTDKPQKPIPLDWEAAMSGELETADASN